MTEDALSFQDLEPKNIPQVVRLIQDIGLGYMSTMPTSFITQYYENISKCPNWRCRILVKDTEVLGFHILTIGKLVPRHAPFYQTPMKFILLSLLYVRPIFIILYYYFMERKISTKQLSYRSQYDSELVYIGIKSEYQSKGLGKLFMLDMKEILESRNVSFLGTEFYKDDQQAAKFYAKYGYEKLGEINTGGRMCVSLKYPVENLPS